MKSMLASLALLFLASACTPSRVADHSDGLTSTVGSTRAHPQSNALLPRVIFADTSCRFGAAQCSRCVDDVVERVRLVYAGTRTATIWQFLPDTITDSYNHIQGLARLPDVETESGTHGRAILTRNNDDGAGLYIIKQTVSPRRQANPQGWRDGKGGHIVGTVDTTDTGLDHPGGVQTLGTTVAVPIASGEDDLALDTEVRFYEFADSYNPVEINRLLLDGSRGEPHQGKNAPARGGAVAFTKLADGRYLLFIVGASYGWLYLSNTTSLSLETEWRFLQYWEPNCTSGDCWTANSLTFLTDCIWSTEGNLYLIAIDGEQEITSTTNTVSVLRLTQDQRTGAIGFVRTATHSPHAPGESWDIFDASYRWGGNLFVTPTGKLSSDVSDRDASSWGDLLIQRFVPPD